MGNAAAGLGVRSGEAEPSSVTGVGVVADAGRDSPFPPAALGADGGTGLFTLLMCPPSPGTKACDAVVELVWFIKIIWRFQCSW